MRLCFYIFFSLFIELARNSVKDTFVLNGEENYLFTKTGFIFQCLILYVPLFIFVLISTVFIILVVVVTTTRMNVRKVFARSFQPANERFFLLHARLMTGTFCCLAHYFACPWSNYRYPEFSWSGSLISCAFLYAD